MTFEQKIFNALWDTDRELLRDLLVTAKDSGHTDFDIFNKFLIPSFEKMISTGIGDRDVSLSQYYLASKIIEDFASKAIKVNEALPIIITGTPEEEFHAIGKTLFSLNMKAYGFKVIDLGVNIKAENFLEAALANNASVIAISCLLLHTACNENGIPKLKYLLKEKKLEDKIKLILGGIPFGINKDLYKTVGGDFATTNILEAKQYILNLPLSKKEESE